MPVRPVASRTSLRRRLSGWDGVAAVERDVGLVRAELLTVVGHVHPAVRIGRGELGEAEQPATDEIVGAPVREQQAVRGLVHQRGELGVRPTHEQEGRDRAPRVPIGRRTRSPHRSAGTARAPTRRCATTGCGAVRRGKPAAGARRRAPARSSAPPAAGSAPSCARSPSRPHLTNTARRDVNRGPNTPDQGVWRSRPFQFLRRERREKRSCIARQHRPSP